MGKNKWCDSCGMEITNLMPCDVCGKRTYRDRMYPSELHVPMVIDRKLGTVAIAFLRVCYECAFVLAECLEDEI